MGANVKFDSLSAYVRHNANVRCECYCSHRGVLDASKLRRWYYCHRWNEAMEVVGCHLYCRECRGRPVRIRPTMARPDRPEWMALESDWKRLVKRLRG